MSSLFRTILIFAIAVVLIGSLWQLPAWDQAAEKVPPDEPTRLVQRAIPPTGSLPPGHPPIDQGPPGSGAPPVGAATLELDEAATAELARALAKLDDAGAREQFETAFRLTFATSRDARDYRRAGATFEQIIVEHPDLAEAYRGQAYAVFNTTMSVPETIALYERAIELDPDYGEAHYALSFMLGNSDPERGAVHFNRAMALGIPDGRNLRERFFKDAD